MNHPNLSLTSCVTHLSLRTENPLFGTESPSLQGAKKIFESLIESDEGP